jgi:hypothetical protein
VDEALNAAYGRLSLLLGNLPMAVFNLVAADAELLIIGREQVTTDLPEWRKDKGKPIYEPTYNGMTRDLRTRGNGWPAHFLWRGKFVEAGKGQVPRT